MAHSRSPTWALGNEWLSRSAWLSEPGISILCEREELIGGVVELEGSGALV